jgi:hypothetical protein
VTHLRSIADGSAGMADGGSGHADTINSGPTCAAGGSDLRDHAVRLRDRRWCYCLRRSCDGQGEASNSKHPEHCFPPVFPPSQGRVAPKMDQYHCFAERWLNQPLSAPDLGWQCWRRCNCDGHHEISDWDAGSEPVHSGVKSVERVWPHTSDGRWLEMDGE